MDSDQFIPGGWIERLSSRGPSTRLGTFAAEKPSASTNHINLITGSSPVKVTLRALGGETCRQLSTVWQVHSKEQVHRPMTPQPDHQHREPSELEGGSRKESVLPPRRDDGSITGTPKRFSFSQRIKNFLSSDLGTSASRAGLESSSHVLTTVDKSNLRLAALGKATSLKPPSFVFNRKASCAHYHEMDFSAISDIISFLRAGYAE